MNPRRVHNRVVEVRGHIIDSQILPKILDEILDSDCEFAIEEVHVGRTRDDSSYARIEITAPSADALDKILARVQPYGAQPAQTGQVRLEPAPADGVFPLDFYSTTNLQTTVNVQGRTVPVASPEMDCGIVVEEDGARCLPLSEVKKGQMIAVGHEGIAVLPLERPRGPSPTFSFMSSSVSSEKPRTALIRDLAREIRQAKVDGAKVLVVAGPAVVHTGSGEMLVQMIKRGWVDYLFAGNALPTHDIESALYGTALGVSLSEGLPLESGHEHHLRAINRIRHEGGIAAAVQNGVLKKGIMHACETQGVRYVLCGSIRDDGPLPEVCTDVIRCQQAMRECIHSGVRVAVMLSTMLHSIAVGNLLPASVTTVCVDINPAVVTKLSDRGSFQSLGLVMDVGSFLRELLESLEGQPGKSRSSPKQART
ncbi:MAG: ornithine cyclodeaminase, nickel-pincer nucleotide-dependent [Chloroflexota bacterium]